MNETHDIDEAITRLLEGRDDPAAAERGRAVAERRLDAAIAGPAPRRQTRRRARPLGLAFAASAVLLTGVAAAATTDLAERILGSKEPAATRVEVVREDPRETMTQAQVVATFHSAFVRNQIGDRLDGELSEPLVQDDRVRLSARRTAEGGICMALYLRMSYAPTEPPRWRLHGGGCGAFMDGWPLMDSIGASAELGTLSYGLVADGVAKVRFIVEGETVDATMGRGAFLWHHPKGVRPSDIEAVLEDGTVVRRDLTWMHRGSHTGPPPAPRVVG